MELVYLHQPARGCLYELYHSASSRIAYMWKRRNRRNTSTAYSVKKDEDDPSLLRYDVLFLVDTEIAPSCETLATELALERLPPWVDPRVDCQVTLLGELLVTAWLWARVEFVTSMWLDMILVSLVADELFFAELERTYVTLSLVQQLVSLFEEKGLLDIEWVVLALIIMNLYIYILLIINDIKLLHADLNVHSTTLDWNNGVGMTWKGKFWQNYPIFKTIYLIIKAAKIALCLLLTWGPLKPAGLVLHRSLVPFHYHQANSYLSWILPLLLIS